jgi:hypothetical protein
MLLKLPNTGERLSPPVRAKQSEGMLLRVAEHSIRTWRRRVNNRVEGVLTFSDIVVGEAFSENVIYAGGTDIEHARTETSDGLEADPGRATECGRSCGLVADVPATGAAHSAGLSKGGGRCCCPQESGLYWLHGISVQNKQEKSFLLSLSSVVDKEEMIGVVIISNAFLERIFHVACTTEILSSQPR